MKLRIFRSGPHASRGVSAFIRCLALPAFFSLAISAKATVPTSGLPDFNVFPSFVQTGIQQGDNSQGGPLQPNAPARGKGEVQPDTTALNQVGATTDTTFDDQALSTEQGSAKQKMVTNQTMGLASGKTDSPVPEPGLLILTGFAGLLLHSARRRITRSNFCSGRKTQPKK